MPAKQALRTHLSEQITRGLPRSTFSDEELLAFLSTATFDGGHIHRYVEGRRADGPGWVVDLQQTIEPFPELLLACLRDMTRMERREKRALKSYLSVTVFVNALETAVQELLQAIEMIPETPTYEAVPRFLLRDGKQQQTRKYRKEAFCQGTTGRKETMNQLQGVDPLGRKNGTSA